MRSMKQQVLFVHSAGPQGRGEGSSLLVAALRKGLGSGYDLRYPIMPDPDDPAYEPWKKRVESEMAELDDDAFIIGHSLGGSVLLKCLSESKRKRPVAGLFLVATPFWGPNMQEFALRDDFSAGLSEVRRIFLYHSRDDDGVPFAHLGSYARALPQATVRELDGYGHVFEKGCRELVEDIRQSSARPPTGDGAL
jgi:uncharacterized protein